MDRVMFSSNSDEWSTPQDVFDILDQEFRFTLDPCASESNHKCERYFTKDDDGLSMDWGGGASVLQSSILEDCRLGSQVL
jgi:site-specific DNA-methyltransferase (adenine-specific)